VLATLARSKVTSSDNARLVPCTTLPSMRRRRPSGLMISPQSWTTVNLHAQILPERSGRDEARGCQPARSAAALTTTTSRGSLGLRTDRIVRMRDAQRRGAVE
jgi:hypothetical protein